MDKKTKILIVAIALALIVAIASTSYAFFTIANKEGEESVITSGTMGLHLEDGPEITLNDAVPGTSITKTFYVENTGNVDTAYDIYLSEVVNTFADKTDLVYTLTSNDGGYSTTGQVEVPSTSSKIVDSQAIPVSGIHHYTLTITFLNKNENQDDNQGKEFSGKIQINEYTNANGGGVDPIDPTPVEIVSGDLDTPSSEVCLGSECFYVVGQEDENHVKLLAKYNLNTDFRIEENRNIQNQYVLGRCHDYSENDEYDNYDSGCSEYYGTVPFSDDYFWMASDSYNFNDEYMPSYFDSTMYDNVSYVYNTNRNENGYVASIAEYVENYKDYLIGNGYDVDARLISLEEMLSLGCQLRSGYLSSATCDLAPNWLKRSSYWLGTANQQGYVLCSSQWDDGNIGGANPWVPDDNGVRPLIILRK